MEMRIMPTMIAMGLFSTAMPPMWSRANWMLAALSGIIAKRWNAPTGIPKFRDSIRVLAARGLPLQR